MAEEEIKYVTQAELAEFAEILNTRLEEMAKRVEEAKGLETRFYRCAEEGCDFATDNLGVFVGHTVDERLRKLGWTAPEEAEPVRHRSVKDFLDCPECFPKFEKIMLERGYRKPEEKKSKGLLG